MITSYFKYDNIFSSYIITVTLNVFNSGSILPLLIIICDINTATAITSTNSLVSYLILLNIIIIILILCWVIDVITAINNK